MPANLTKKSVVKHRTKTPYYPAQRKYSKGDDGGTGANSTALGDKSVKGKGRNGFQVGPKHAPDGAYLGRGKMSLAGRQKSFLTDILLSRPCSQEDQSRSDRKGKD